MGKRRVTIRDIAKEAGVHFTTVSRALSHHPRIPEETAARIRDIAEAMGYVPDPMLSALMSYRTELQEPTYHGNIAWIDNYPEPEGWKQHEIYHRYHDGAQVRAEQLGYRLEEFWIRGKDMTAKRLSDILSTRNIRGLLLCPQPIPGLSVSLEWERFCAVTYGYTLAEPPLHRVASHTAFAMTELIRQVRKLGYRRLGYAIASSSDERIFNLWSGTFLTHQMRWPRSERVPLLASERINRDKFLRWFDRQRPDVIVSQNDMLIDTLEEAGYRVPQDVGFASPSLIKHPRDLSGIDENSLEMGRAAVDMLVGLLHRNERGLPLIPYYLLVQGQWHAGCTLNSPSEVQ